MEEKQVTIELIVSLFKSYKEKKRLKDIKQSVVNLLYPEVLMVSAEESDAVSKEVENVLKEDKRLDKESFLVYEKGYYSKRRSVRKPEDPLPTPYIGAAGECAVMAELMFRGYNANRMMIDEGVDIIAAKNNVYYYIQVKTVNAKDGKFHFRIPQYRFNQYVDSQIRYICVGRSEGRLYFFKFTPDNINDYIFNQYIKQSNGEIHINIKFHDRSGNPILYSNKEKDILYNMNNFEL